MKKIFYHHTEEALLGAGVLLLLIVGAYFAWGVLGLISQFNMATDRPAPQARDVHFRLDDARSLGVAGGQHK